MNDFGHQFIKWISPKYKQKCIWCGATDAPGDDKFNKLCPDRDADDFIEELRQTVVMLRCELKEAKLNCINSAYIKSDFSLGERVRKKSGSS